MAKRFTSLQLCAYAMVGVVVASGCSDSSDDSSSVSRGLLHCQEFLGEENVRSAIGAMGEGDLVVRAASTVKELSRKLALEAKAWSEEDLLHDSYRACRVDLSGAEGEGYRVMEATVKWSVWLMDDVKKPKPAETWRKVNDQVFVETQMEASGTRLLISCEVPGAPARQSQEMPLEVAEPRRARCPWSACSGRRTPWWRCTTPGSLRPCVGSC